MKIQELQHLHRQQKLSAICVFLAVIADGFAICVTFLEWSAWPFWTAAALGTLFPSVGMWGAYVQPVLTRRKLEREMIESDNGNYVAPYPSEHP